MTSVKASDALVSCNNTGVCCVRVTNGRVTELIGGQTGRQTGIWAVRRLAALGRRQSGRTS